MKIKRKKKESAGLLEICLWRLEAGVGSLYDTGWSICLYGISGNANGGSSVVSTCTDCLGRSDRKSVCCSRQSFEKGDFGDLYLAVWALAGLGITVFLIWKKHLHEAVLALILLLIPMSVRLQSMPRYFIGSGIFVWGAAELFYAKKIRFLMPVLVTGLAIMEFWCLWQWFANNSLMV